MSSFSSNSKPEVAQKGKSKIKLPTKSPHVTYFMPMLESMAEKDDLSEVAKARVV